MEIGSDVTFIGSSSFNRAGINHALQLVVRSGAALTIGSMTGISGGAIFAECSVEIGSHCLLGANCKIFDTDFHPVGWEERRASKPPARAPVKIGDDVWLGTNVTVLKGVTIGPRSVVAAGSIVTTNIPADCVAAGVPAKVVRQLKRAD